VGGKSDSVSDSVCGKSDSVCGKVDRLRVSPAGGRLVVVCADFTKLVLERHLSMEIEAECLIVVVVCACVRVCVYVCVYVW
jgi:hypothetical protein